MTASATATFATTPSPSSTEVDTLKSQTLTAYRAKLMAWFSARFDVRGMIPFDILRTLRVLVTMQVSTANVVVGWAMTASSGNATFDGAVTNAMDAIVSKGEPLPPPPYPELAGKPLSVVFSCADPQRCQ